MHGPRSSPAEAKAGALEKRREGAASASNLPWILVLCHSSLATCHLPLAPCPLSLATCALSLVPCHLRLVPCPLALAPWHLPLAREARLTFPAATLPAADGPSRRDRKAAP